MKPATKAWLKKAEGDVHTASREFRARKRPNYDAACFHAQQAIEKYLKALLIENGRSFPKTHDLIEISKLCVDIIPNLLLFEVDLTYLTQYAVAFRYPGESAVKKEAETAVKYMKDLRDLILVRIKRKK